MSDHGQEALEPYLAQLAELIADALAPRLAAHLTTQAAAAATATPTRRLLTLDQLVDQLPAGKTAKTWKRWLYERTRKGQIPGARKIGGRLFFDPEQTIPWLTQASTGGLDAAGEQSLDRDVPAHRHGRRSRGGD